MRTKTNFLPTTTERLSSETVTFHTTRRSRQCGRMLRELYTERRREPFRDIIEDQATVSVKGTKVIKRSREDETDFSAAAKVRRVH